MKSIINLLQGSGYALYLGCVLAAYGVPLDGAEFWVITVPVVALVAWKSWKN